MISRNADRVMTTQVSVLGHLPEKYCSHSVSNLEKALIR